MRTLLFLAAVFISLTVSAQQTWNGLVVAPEDKCSPFDRKTQYPYSQSVEDIIVDSMGGEVYGPYTGRYFANDRMTDIEHLVSVSEAHSSGLCAASAEVRAQFSSDPINLTLAGPKVNRCGKGGKCGYDAGEWLPEKNKCWFANQVVLVKRKYNLTVDINEAQSLNAILENCDSTEMVMYPKSTTQEPLDATTEAALKLISRLKDKATSSSDPLSLYDDNQNGRITCKEARAHKIAPVTRSHDAYQYMYDADGDGTVCE